MKEGNTFFKISFGPLNIIVSLCSVCGILEEFLYAAVFILLVAMNFACLFCFFPF